MHAQAGDMGPLERKTERWRRWATRAGCWCGLEFLSWPSFGFTRPCGTETYCLGASRAESAKALSRDACRVRSLQHSTRNRHIWADLEPVHPVVFGFRR